jgi:hypothetical protein
MDYHKIEGNRQGITGSVHRDGSAETYFDRLAKLQEALSSLC